VDYISLYKSSYTLLLELNPVNQLRNVLPGTTVLIIPTYRKHHILCSQHACPVPCIRNPSPRSPLHLHSHRTLTVYILCPLHNPEYQAQAHADVVDVLGPLVASHWGVCHLMGVSCGLRVLVVMVVMGGACE
jgi:hypothetical protein